MTDKNESCLYVVAGDYAIAGEAAPMTLNLTFTGNNGTSLSINLDDGTVNLAGMETPEATKVFFEALESSMRVPSRRIQELLEANNRYQQYYREEAAKRRELENELFYLRSSGRTFITIPTNEAEAEAMQKTGYAWLLQYAPHRLFGKLVRHIKRGAHYRVLGEAEVQISKPGIGCVEGCRMLSEGDKLTIYKGDDEKLWARFPDEFNDGRFEPA